MPAAWMHIVAGAVLSPNSAAAKRACSSGSDSTVRFHHGVGLRGFRLKHRKRGNVRVPFNQRRARTEALQGRLIQRPNLSCDASAVRVEANVTPAATRECVAGEMKFLHR